MKKSSSNVNHRLALLPVMVSLALTGCGGGGSGLSATLGGVAPSSSSTNSGVVNDLRNFSTPKLAGKIDVLVGTGAGYAITDIKARDINSDGVDEIVIGGRMSQPLTQATFQQSALHLFGWNNDRNNLTNETATWFSNGDNIIGGTEPSIKFGNFTGHTDGKLDMYVAGGIDSDLHATLNVKSVLYKNNGNNTFTRIDAPNNGWAHGSAVGDINGDGIDDTVNAGYCGGGCDLTTMLGGADPTFLQTGFEGNSVAIGKFSSTDAGKNYAITSQDTGSGTSGTFTMHYFDNANNNWQPVNITTTDTSGIVTPYLHTIRIETINLNNDGMSDFIVVARPRAINNNWDSSTEKMYVMFYKNVGNNQFERTAVFFKDNTMVYNIEIKDVNSDGVKDIMLSSQIGNSTVLLGKVNGNDIVYVEGNTSLIADFESSFADPSIWHNGVSGTNIVKGPNGKSYLVSTGKFYEGVNHVMNVFYSEITNGGTSTIDTSIQALKQAWPQLTDAQATQILSLTGTNYLDGILLNLNRAMNPIDLRIPLSNGTWTTMNGHITGVSLGQYSKIKGIDAFSRDYSVDMSYTQTAPTTQWTKFNFNPTFSNTALMTYAGSNYFTTTYDTKFVKDFQLNEQSNVKQYSFSGNIYQLSSNSALYLSGVKTNHNPWFNMSGAWGKVKNATMTELAGIYSKNNWTARGGLITAKTDIRQGLVTDVSTIRAAWADIDYKVNDNLRFGGGILPTVFQGSVTANVPVSFQEDGSVAMKTVKAKIDSPMVSYARVNYVNEFKKNMEYNAGGMVTNDGNFMFQLSTKYFFN